MKSLISRSFIQKIIKSEIKKDYFKKIHTRFPPYPNGYLHIGHAKSICLNFGIARKYRGKCNLRIDDTNPIEKRSFERYVHSIKKDIKWLGFNWDGEVRYASNYQEMFYKYAVELIQKKLAYVDHLDRNSIKEYRGNFNQVGKNSPYRDRTVEENLELFKKMKSGLYEEGRICLRAKIDMYSPYMILRDPVLYRIKKNIEKSDDLRCKKFTIYPTYDFAHCISDALEGITHSLCTLEFRENRRLYDWILNNISIVHKPKQYEFSRLNLEYTVMSKRKLSQLIDLKMVESWEDPRLPTISGMRRRGYTAESIRMFCQKIGVTKQESRIEMKVLESCVRKDLDLFSQRMMGVLNPVLLIIENMKQDEEHNLIIFRHPKNRKMGVKFLKFNNRLYVDKFDFLKKDGDLDPLLFEKMFRLRHAYTIEINRVERDKQKNISKIYCQYKKKPMDQFFDKSKRTRKIIHWVSAKYGIRAEFRIFNHLFTEPYPGENFLKSFNSDSMLLKQGIVEPNLLDFQKGEPFQLEREGYFCIDSTSDYSRNSKLIINQTVSLKRTKDE
ncbi:glutamine--tRNA ligase [Candidatus Riesia pediculicola]|uniref:glutamine--tRNA ligase n=1 Tax=Candidatus Riesia pediculicola TaxID=401619 RepID=UPI0009C1CD31|nr:glutamine--tRNA ligase [Candidatus Riesia pediculicola]ARC54187.1 glutamine--tRNA ligase [Candidatus Riesia pediculicola]